MKGMDSELIQNSSITKETICNCKKAIEVEKAKLFDLLSKNKNLKEKLQSLRNDSSLKDKSIASLKRVQDEHKHDLDQKIIDNKESELEKILDKNNILKDTQLFEYEQEMKERIKSLKSEEAVFHLFKNMFG